MKYILFFLSFPLVALNAFSQTASSGMDQQLVQYFQDQQYGKAAEYIRFRAGPDSMNSRYLSLLGYSYYMSNQYANAVTCFDRLLKADSVNTRAIYYLGKISEEKGNLLAALTCFCRLVTLKPGIAAYYKQLASLWNKVGNKAAAGWYYQLAYRANPNDAAVTASLAANWIGQQLYSKADSILDRALLRDSMQARVIIVRIRSAYAQKDYPVIFPLARRLKKMHFLSLKPFVMAAIAYFDLKKYDSCIATCNFLAKNKMRTRTTVYLAALSYKALKQYNKAISCLDTCLKMSLNVAANDYFSAKGNILELMHQPSKALTQYDTAYYIFHDPLQLYHKALVYDTKFNNYTIALRYYHRYLKHRERPVSKGRKKILAFVEKRVEQLEKWEKQP